MKTKLVPISYMTWPQDGHNVYALYCCLVLPHAGKNKFPSVALWWTGRKWSTRKSDRKVMHNFQSALDLINPMRKMMREGYLEMDLKDDDVNMQTEVNPVSIIGFTGTNLKPNYAIYTGIGIPCVKKSGTTLEPHTLWWTGRTWTTKNKGRKVVFNLESAQEMANVLLREMHEYANSF